MTPKTFGSARVLVLGKDGQLGAQLVQELSGKCHLAATGRQQIDLTVPAQIRSAIREIAPDIIFNAAAYTAVDAAEDAHELAFQINSHGPATIATEAKRLGALLIHYSTDYVFDGTKLSPYLESDPTSPLNVYGASKLEGESAVRQAGCDYLLFRVGWLYSTRGKNFYRTVLSLAKSKPELRIVDDQQGTPTSAVAVATASVKAARHVVSSGRLHSYSGVYHMAGAGATTWYDFAQEIIARSLQNDLSKPKVVPISTEEFGARARRPRNSVLDAAKLMHTFGMRLPDWQQQLHDLISAEAAPPFVSAA
jgi:dTDP-4-dehydrorhamnose reductase